MTGELVAVAPLAPVARKTTEVPLGALMLLAQVPQLCLSSST